MRGVVISFYVENYRQCLTREIPRNIDRDSVEVIKERRGGEKMRGGGRSQNQFYRSFG
jgi:hypothetical protein